MDVYGKIVKRIANDYDAMFVDTQYFFNQHLNIDLRNLCVETNASQSNWPHDTCKSILQSMILIGVIIKNKFIYSWIFMWCIALEQ